MIVKFSNIKFIIFIHSVLTWHLYNQTCVPFYVWLLQNFSSSIFPGREKTPAFSFRVDVKYFKNGAFRKRWWCHDNHVFSLAEFTNPKWQLSGAFLDSSANVMETASSWCIFRVKSLFNSNSSGVVWTAGRICYSFWLISVQSLLNSCQEHVKENNYATRAWQYDVKIIEK